MASDKEDVVIIYDHADFELVQYLSGSLRMLGVNSWFLDPLNLSNAADISQRAEAVLHAKVLLVVLSETGVQNKQLKDEIALAYISNSSIIPIGRSHFKLIAKHMDSGMKLMLAKINWSFFTKTEHYDERLQGLVEAIRHELRQSATMRQQSAGVDEAEDEEEEEQEVINVHMLDGNSVQPSEKMGGQETDRDPVGAQLGGLSLDFWDRHFGEKTEASWIEFKEKFLSDYGEKITDHFGQEKEKWAIHLIYKDIFELHKTVDKSTYDKFCGKKTKGDRHLFFNRLKEYAVGSFAMREVFDMDSTVRLTAIRNLGHFQTAAVISALFSLITDADPNIRAVAALALAKTGNRTKKIEDSLIKLLNDEDRLVRESACLSLGHMKSSQGIPHIVDLWRNDAIKHVREAAELALSRIGGDEAEQAMKVTQVLSSEMHSLRTSVSARS